MNYQKIENGNYNIHIIKNKKYHNIAFSIYFVQNIDEEKYAYHNLLVNVLTNACKKYDTRSKIIKRTQDLYSINPDAVSFRCGNLLVTKFSISILDSKYLDKSIIKDNILLIKEILLNPLVENKEFSKKYFDLALNDEIKKTERKDENLMIHANYEAIKLSSEKDEAYKISKFISFDMLNKLTNKGLYQTYLDMLENSRIDFCLAGNIKNTNDLVDFIKKEFHFNNKYNLKDIYVRHNDFNIKTKIVRKKMNVEQDKLAVIIKAYDLTLFEIRYVAAIYNGILGGNNNSFLNTVIREENAISYSIYSFYNRPDCTIMINGGFNSNNYDNVIKIIKTSMEKIEKGEFSNKLLESAKRNFIIDLLNYDESNASLIAFYYGKDLLNGQDIKERIEETKKLTKEDIMNLAKKLKIASIYNVEGEL